MKPQIIIAYVWLFIWYDSGLKFLIINYQIEASNNSSLCYGMIAKQGQSQAKKIFDILSLIFAFYIYKLIIPKYKAKKIFDILSFNSSNIL